MITLSGESVALVGLFVTTIAGLVGQYISIRKSSIANADQLAQMKVEAEERRAAAKDLVEQTRAEALMVSEKAKADAFMLAEKTKHEVTLLAEETKAQAQLLAAKAEQQAIEMKLLLLRQERQVISQTKEITSAIKESEQIGAQIGVEGRTAIAAEIKELVAGVGLQAEAAYKEANQVNVKIQRAHEDNKAQGVEINKRSDKLEAMTQSIDETVKDTHECIEDLPVKIQKHLSDSPIKVHSANDTTDKPQPKTPGTEMEVQVESDHGTPVTIKGRLRNE